MSSSNLKQKIINLATKPQSANVIKKLKKGPTVISYHGVEREIFDDKIQGLQVSEDIFIEQIRYLADNFEIISMDELFNLLQTKANKKQNRLSPEQVVITFDDGYENVLRCAAPVLKKYRAPFTVFVNTAYTDRTNNIPTSYLRLAIHYLDKACIRLPSQGKDYDIATPESKQHSFREITRALKNSPRASVENIVSDLKGNFSAARLAELERIFFSERLLDWKGIKTLATMGATIGSHCHQHTILSQHQPNEVVDAELCVSKKLIEQHVGECKYFAYPNGTQEYISKYARDSVQKAGYLLGFSVEAGEITANSDEYILPRIWAGPSLKQTIFSMTTTFRRNKRYANWVAEMEVS